MTLLEKFNKYSERDRELYLMREAWKRYSTEPEERFHIITYKELGARFNISGARARMIHLKMDRDLNQELEDQYNEYYNSIHHPDRCNPPRQL